MLLRLCRGGTAFAAGTLLLRTLGRGENRACKQHRRRGGENRTCSHLESPVSVSPHRGGKHNRSVNVPLSRRINSLSSSNVGTFPIGPPNSASFASMDLERQVTLLGTK